MEKFEIIYDRDSHVIMVKPFQTWGKDDVETAVPIIKKLISKNECRRVLANLTENQQGFVTREARGVLKKYADDLRFDKAAIVGTNPATRMVMKIAVSILGNSHNTRFFKTKEEALEWLEQNGKSK